MIPLISQEKSCSTTSPPLNTPVISIFMHSLQEKTHSRGSARSHRLQFWRSCWPRRILLHCWKSWKIHASSPFQGKTPQRSTVLQGKHRLHFLHPSWRSPLPKPTCPGLGHCSYLSKSSVWTFVFIELLRTHRLHRHINVGRPRQKPNCRPFD